MITLLEESGFCVKKEVVEDYRVSRRLEDDKGNVVILEEEYFPPDEVESEIIVIKGELPPLLKDYENRLKTLNYEEQLSELLKIGLTIHPLDETDCWGIFASTKEKAVERYAKIKKAFPLTTPKDISPMEGDFGVDLYGELK